MVSAKRLVATTALALAVCLFAATGHCNASRKGYFGGGLLLGSISSDHPSIDGESGTGMHLVWGLHITPRFACEMDLGGFSIDTAPTPDIYYPEDSADFMFIGLGFTGFFTPPEEKVFTPWASLLFTLQTVMWDDYYYDLTGLGLSPGVGVDMTLHKGHTLRLEARMHWADLESSYDDSGGDTHTVTIGLSYVYRYGNLIPLGGGW